MAKKTRHIELFLITAALAGCHHPQPARQWQNGNNTYIRSDSTAPYTAVGHRYYGSPGLWYYAFRPYGMYYNGYYRRAGYYSNAIGEASNIGYNNFKSGVIRGGFGSHAYSVSS